MGNSIEKRGVFGTFSLINIRRWRRRVGKGKGMRIMMTGSIEASQYVMECRREERR